MRGWPMATLRRASEPRESFACEENPDREVGDSGKSRVAASEETEAPRVRPTHLIQLSIMSDHHGFEGIAPVIVQFIPENGDKIIAARMFIPVHGTQSCMPERLGINGEELVT